jgi:3-methyl-2-oxobutanoate hydroxymethyltransferase
MGGFRVQAREEAEANQLLEDARSLQDAGADLVVLECIPAALAAKVTASLTVPVIGIGAGLECDGQVLVMYDMLGITPGKRPRFSKDFLQESGSVAGALKAYALAVKNRTFPGEEHAF